MTKTLLNALLAISLSGTMVTPCKKDKDDVKPSAATMIQREWAFNLTATDYNKDGIMQNNEKGSNRNVRVIFYESGKTTYKNLDVSNAPTAEFSWSLYSNDTKMLLNDLGDIYITPPSIRCRNNQPYQFRFDPEIK